VIEPGRTLLHYRIVEKIGEGGMGVVWKALDPALDREVAIKILPEELGRDQERLARFEREAKLLASLDHPNIATVHGLLSDGEIRFLAMELVRGEDLSVRIARGPLSIEDAVTICRPIADAVEAAHDNDVIHRDLKPANVVVSTEGQVKVLDFGLAKSMEAAAASGDPAASPTITSLGTRAGMLLGTAAYMSPEQARGYSVDRRADIWAFGCILFECLTGRRCFTGETMSDTLAGVLRADLEWDALPKGTPPAVVRLLRRCLDRDPRQRLRDIGEARIVLEGQLDEPVNVQAESAPAPRRRWVGVAAALLLAVVSGLTAWNLREPPPLPLRKFSDPAFAPHGGPWDTVAPAISPDATRLAFVQDRSLWIRDLGELEAQLVPDSDGAQSIFWSPDSRWVAYSTGLHLWKVQVDGTAPIKIAQLPGRMSPAGGGAWMDDGTMLVTTGGSGVLSVPSQGGDPVMVLDPGERENDFHDISALPDGRSVLFLVHGERGASMIAAWDGKKRRDVLDVEGQWLRDPVYSPSGHIVFQRTTSNIGLWAVPFSLDRLETTGEPFLVAPGGGAASAAADGTLVYLKGAASRQRQLTIFERTGELLMTVGEPLDGINEPAFSPDGRRIAVSAENGGQRDIWIYDVDTGTRNRLTFTPEAATFPRWFPDGERMAFICGEPRSVCVQRADGSGETERLAVDIGAAESFDISPDGSAVIYDTDGKGTRTDLWVFDIGEASGEAFLDTPDFESEPRFSRDGKLLAHVAWELGMEEVFLREYPGRAGKWQVSTEGGNTPIWSGDEVFWLEGVQLLSREVSRKPEVTLGPARALFRNGAFRWGYDVSPDGRRIVAGVTPGGEEETALVVVQNWFAEFANR
jgi:serine/threonine protein kinase